jgi:hypothetical protein
MFGFSAFSELPFSTQENNSVVALSGLSLDIDEGIVTVIANAVIEELTGLGLDIDEGTVTVVIAQTVALTGESLDIDEGTPTVVFTADVALTGESLDIDEGTVTVTGTATVVVTGESISCLDCRTRWTRRRLDDSLYRRVGYVDYGNCRSRKHLD